MWECAAGRYGLSRAARCLGRWLILKTSPDKDYERGAVCAVWHSPGTVAQELGVSPRVLNTAERDLEKAGFIVRTSFRNGRRCGHRCAESGKVVWAAGINLAPMIDRFAELADTARRAAEDAQAIHEHRADILLALKQMDEVGGEGFQTTIAAIIPRRRPSEVRCLERLKSILARLRAAIRAAFEAPGQSETSDRADENDRPYTKEKQDIKSCTPRPKPDAGRIVPHPKDVCRIASGSFRDTITFHARGSMSPDWRTITSAAREQAQMLGIDPHVWQSALNHLGPELAASCLALVDRNSQRTDRYRVENPVAAFREIVRRHRTNPANLPGLFAEAMRSSRTGAAPRTALPH